MLELAEGNRPVCGAVELIPIIELQDDPSGAVDRRGGRHLGPEQDHRELPEVR